MSRLEFLRGAHIKVGVASLLGHELGSFGSVVEVTHASHGGKRFTAGQAIGGGIAQSGGDRPSVFKLPSSPGDVMPAAMNVMFREFHDFYTPKGRVLRWCVVMSASKVYKLSMVCTMDRQDRTFDVLIDCSAGEKLRVSSCDQQHAGQVVANSDTMCKLHI